MKLSYQELRLIEKLLIKHHAITNNWKHGKRKKIVSDVNGLKLATKIIKEQLEVMDSYLEIME